MVSANICIKIIAIAPFCFLCVVLQDLHHDLVSVAKL